LYDRVIPESAAALAAGCKSAVFARGNSLELGAACFAERAGAAGFDFSTSTPAVRRGFATLCAGVGIGVDVSAAEATATLFPT
jgi:hypothetical protein